MVNCKINRLENILYNNFGNSFSSELVYQEFHYIFLALKKDYINFNLARDLYLSLVSEAKGIANDYYFD